MVTFKTIKVENYYSIGNITYDVVHGLHKLSGANGQGKTSLCSSIAQGLYNRSIKADSTLDATYNKVTGLPYKITIDFETNGVNFKVVNDRSKNNIFVYREEIDITPKGIKNQLALIQTIIGLDYATFVSLTYLSQSSMNSVFDLSDTNNILHKFFDVDLLDFLNKELKNERKEVTRQLAFLEQQVNDLIKTIGSLEQYEVIDISEMVSEKYTKVDALNLLLSGNDKTKITVFKTRVDSKLKEFEDSKIPVIQLKAQYDILKEQIEKLNTGTCPLCGSGVTGIIHKTTEKIDSIRKESEKLKEVMSKFLKELTELKETLSNLENSYNSKVSVLEKDILGITNKITILEEKNRNFSRIKQDIEMLTIKRNTLTLSVDGLKDRLSFVVSAIQVISSGSITKQYVASFIHTFNTKITSLLQYLDIKLHVEVKEVGGKILYNIKNASGAEIEFNNLSSGERTRVSLIVLLSIVETLEVLTNVSVNLIIFDELLSVLDTEGVSVLKDILNKYRANKNTFVVLHHNEIEEDYFDSTILLKKVNNLTRIERIV